MQRKRSRFKDTPPFMSDNITCRHLPSHQLGLQGWPHSQLKRLGMLLTCIRKLTILQICDMNPLTEFGENVCSGNSIVDIKAIYSLHQISNSPLSTISRASFVALSKSSFGSPKASFASFA